MLNKSVFPFLAALLLTACASGPRIGTMQAPEVNFSDSETFAFVDPLATDRAGYASLISRQLILSIRREREMLGFGFVEDPAQADMLVNAHTHLDEKIRAREVTDPLMGADLLGLPLWVLHRLAQLFDPHRSYAIFRGHADRRPHRCRGARDDLGRHGAQRNHRRNASRCRAGNRPGGSEDVRAVSVNSGSASLESIQHAVIEPDRGVMS